MSRKDRVIELIEGGLSGDGLIAKVCSEFNLTEHAADWDIKEAQATIRDRQKAEEKKAKLTLDDHISERRMLYEQAIADGDKDLALKALQDLGKLTGTYEEVIDKQVEVVFTFPDEVGYKPLTREAIKKAMEMVNNEK